MAQYYRPRPATTSSAASDTHTEVLSSCDGRHQCGSNIHFENALASSSILVFPNPPSEQTSRSESRFEFNGSTASLPIDVSVGSLRSRSRSGSRSEVNPNEHQRSWQHISGTIRRNCDEFPLEEESDWQLDAEDLRVRREHVRHTNHWPRRGAGHTRISPNLSTGSASLTPQPPFRLPFLSFLQSFLSLDESTLHLLSRSPDSQVSILFPCPPGSTFPHEESDEETMHGVHQLLLYNPDKPQNRALLKAAIDPSETPAGANPFLASPMRIQVWRFLRFVMEGGAKAWREVRT